MALICSYSSFKVKWYKCIDKVSIVSLRRSYEHLRLYTYLYLVLCLSDNHNIQCLIKYIIQTWIHLSIPIIKQHIELGIKYAPKFLGTSLELRTDQMKEIIPLSLGINIISTQPTFQVSRCMYSNNHKTSLFLILVFFV